MKWVLSISSLRANDGGPPIAALRLATELVKLDQEVTVLYLADAESDLATEFRPAYEAGVRFHEVRMRKLGSFRWSFRYLRQAIKLSKNAEVLVAHGFYQSPCVTTWMASRRNAGAKFFLQPHGVFEPYQEQTHVHRKRVFRSIVGNRILADVDTFFAASDQEKSGLSSSTGVDDAKILVHTLGLEAPDVDTRIPARVTRPSSRTVLFLSRIATKKRLDLLLDACMIKAGSAEEFAVSVCGSGSEPLVSELKQLAGGLPVTFHGHVSGPFRAQLENEADLFCLPSDNENFGQAVTEAMRVGLPIITTSTTGSSTHVTQADAGWVLESPTSDELAQCIVDALGDRDDLLQKGRNAAKYVQDAPTWVEVAQHWIKAARA